MKFLIVFVVVVAAASAQSGFQRSRSFAQPRFAPPAPIVKRAPASRPSSGDQGAEIVRYDNEVRPDGYAYSYETSNGIQGEAQGSADAAQGSFSYYAPDGQQISLSYKADAEGFQPQGSHLPVAPPVPDYILRSIEYNNAHPESKK